MGALDVLIIGGGLQGLVLLREFTAAGYGSLLLTKGDLGAGQTLHSHGLLNSGTGLMTGALGHELHALTLPYLQRLNVPVHGDDRSFLLVPPPMVDQLTPLWEANRYHPEPVDHASLPGGFQPVAPVYRVRGFNVHKRRLVEAFAAGVGHLVLRGTIVDADDGVRVRETATGEILPLHPRAVIVAAGCGTKRLLRDVFGLDELGLDRITYTRPHMICVRGPASLLPDIGTVLSPEILVVGHPVADRSGSPERVVEWYATPFEATPSRYDDAPDDATADVDGPIVRSGIEALVRLLPLLTHRDERIQATVFAGYKQEFDGQSTQRVCELIDVERNVLMTLPSVLANAVPNAVDALSILGQRVEKTGGDANTVGRGDPHIGEVKEHQDGARWTDWGEFAQAYGAAIG